MSTPKTTTLVGPAGDIRVVTSAVARVRAEFDGYVVQKPAPKPPKPAAKA